MSIVCPAGVTVQGIDVSQLNGTVDWAMVKAAGIEFGYARLAENTLPDSQFETNWSAMQAAGVVRGAYQFFHPGQDPAAQANVVVSTLGRLAAADLPVAVDLEVTDNQSPSTIVANLATFMNAVEAGTGKRPVILTSRSFWDTNVQSTAFAASPLWVPAWAVQCPNLPSAWTSWAFWQDADNAQVTGVGGLVDHDRFNGSAADLVTFAGMTVMVDGAVDGPPTHDATDFIDGPVDGPRGDAPTNPATGHGGGCCDSSGATSNAAAWLVVGLALVCRRRRAA